MSPGKLRGSKAVILLLLIILPSILISIPTFIAVAYDEREVGSNVSYIIAGGLLFLTFIVWAIDGFWYIPYHARDKPEKYFNKIGLVQAAIEYQFSRKLLNVTAPISIFSFFAYLINSYFILRIPWLYGEPAFAIQHGIFFGAMWVCSFATVILAIRFVLQHRRKDFGFYLSRAYFMVSSQKEDGVEKFRYLTLALDTYNRFLERNLNLKIKDIMRIYSLIMSASVEQKIKIRESIGKALENDRLELARQLAEISKLPDEEEFLKRERTLLNQRLKDILTIIIPAMISVVGFITAILTQAGILASPSP